MPRPPRIQYPGAIYHIVARSNPGKKLFLDSVDYKFFCKLYREVLEKYEWISYSYCLMPNHYHLFIKIKTVNLSEGMKCLNSEYAQVYNLKNHSYGHVFQGRFKSILVENLNYMGKLIRYILFNPIEAGLASKISHWEWSSYEEIIGNNKKRACTNVREVLAIFDNDLDKAKVLLKQFLDNTNDYKKDKKMGFESKLILGSQNFIDDVLEKYVDNNISEISKNSKFVKRLSLKRVFGIYESKEERNKNIKIAYRKYSYTQKEIANYLRLDRMTIGRIIKK